MSIASAFHALESFAERFVAGDLVDATRRYTARQTLELRAACVMGDNWTNLETFLSTCSSEELADIIETWPNEMRVS